MQPILWIFLQVLEVIFCYLKEIGCIHLKYHQSKFFDWIPEVSFETLTIGNCIELDNSLLPYSLIYFLFTQSFTQILEYHLAFWLKQQGVMGFVLFYIIPIPEPMHTTLDIEKNYYKTV